MIREGNGSFVHVLFPYRSRIRQAMVDKKDRPV